ncbi:hypothetical protein VTK26DRAFT_3894 [Humicola hyalothermophila]
MQGTSTAVPPRQCSVLTLVMHILLSSTRITFRMGAGQQPNGSCWLCHSYGLHASIHYFGEQGLSYGTFVPLFFFFLKSPHPGGVWCYTMPWASHGQPPPPPPLSPTHCQRHHNQLGGGMVWDGGNTNCAIASLPAVRTPNYLTLNIQRGIGAHTHGSKD